jgi:hypothetical protein
MEEKASVEMSAAEHDDCMQIMKDNMDLQSEPKLGIFWYDEINDELFGVTRIEAMDVPFPDGKDKKTVRTLHRDWWKKQEMRVKAGRERNPVFLRNYTQIPRGRLFQNRDGSFEVMCGSWINDHIIELVIEEFDLQNEMVKTVIDEHWELGHGWSE